VTDVTPTVLDVTGISVPETFNGHPQIPLHGTSLVDTWENAESPTTRGAQYFEQFGHRGIWKDGWKAVTYHRKGDDFDTEQWSLYNLDEDFSECHDLADEQPEKLKEMVDAWWAEAEQYDVMPLDDRTIELFGGAPRPGTPHSRDGYVYYHPMSHVPADASPRLGGRAWKVTAEVTVPEEGCEGVLYARGSHNGGHTFFIKDGKVQFDYNALGEHSRAVGPVELSPGRHNIEARFVREDQVGRLAVVVDGTEIGSTEVTKIVRMLSSTGVDIGADRLSTVVDDYEGPFEFTGELHKVTFRMLSKAEQQDIETLARTELAKE
jgi:arylsulfatase